MIWVQYSKKMVYSVLYEGEIGLNYHVQERNGQIILENSDAFELAHIFECGQCFRWSKETDGSYTGVARGKILNVNKTGERVIFNNTTMEDFEKIWVSYFDLDRDYEAVKRSLKKEDLVMEKATAHGHGIRILKQDEWETLLSFILSTNRGIPIIKKSIEALCRKYGNYLGEYRGNQFYDFPKPEALVNKSVEEIMQSHTGYRAKFIVDAAAMVSERQIDIVQLKNLTTEEARVQLIRFGGIGPKVSDCILLFAMGKTDAFPIDVWVKRVIEYFYLPKGTSMKKIQEFAKEQFGEMGGFAQQYLFYYARELGVGKN